LEQIEQAIEETLYELREGRDEVAQELLILVGEIAMQELLEDRMNTPNLER
jgi:hypothetical protein